MSTSKSAVTCAAFCNIQMVGSKHRLHEKHAVPLQLITLAVVTLMRKESAKLP